MQQPYLELSQPQPYTQIRHERNKRLLSICNVIKGTVSSDLSQLIAQLVLIFFFFSSNMTAMFTFTNFTPV